MILTDIQMQAKVICWTLFRWHDFDCCEGKLTVPSSWTSWRLSLRWAAYKIQCECRWTSLILGNLCIFSFQLDLMWMYMNITSFKQSFHFRPTNISLSQKGSIYPGVWTWQRSKSKRGEKLSKWWRKCCEWPWTQCTETIFFQSDINQVPFQGSRTGAQNGKSRYLTKSLLHKNKEIWVS